MEGISAIVGVVLYDVRITSQRNTSGLSFYVMLSCASGYKSALALWNMALSVTDPISGLIKLSSTGTELQHRKTAMQCGRTPRYIIGSFTHVGPLAGDVLYATSHLVDWIVTKHLR